MVLSYLQNIKKQLFSSIPMIANLAMQYKVIRKEFSSKFLKQINLKRHVQGIYIKSFSKLNLNVKVQGCVRTELKRRPGFPRIGQKKIQ